MNNIFLVCLVNENDLKKAETDYTNILEQIVKDVHVLETAGINLACGINLKGNPLVILTLFIAFWFCLLNFWLFHRFKGTIVNVTFDNLGGNVGLGFAQGFAARYFCRMCLTTNDETKEQCRALTEKYRNKSNYDEAIRIIENSSDIDYKETKGIAAYCVLNNLEYFHILDNWTGDIMHDLCEGTIIVLIENFLTLSRKLKIFKNDNEFKILVSNYDFGILSRQSIPSEVKLERKNLNQSASQMKCLLQHFPYIFHKYKQNSELETAWICVNTMMKIVRICYSNTITEQNLIELDALVECHLSNVMKCFDIKLKPKHHFMTHYSEIIRRSGPICHMSTLRFEMKHKSLTKTMKNNNNFKNVTNSITDKYLHKNAFNSVYADHIEHSKFQVVEKSLLHKFKFLLENFDNLNSIRSLKYLRINSDYYEKLLILKHNLNYFEIREILNICNDFYFVCAKFDRIIFDDFLVSVEIKQSTPIQYALIKHSDLEFSKAHDKKMYENRVFILSDSLFIE